ncbi:polysaccharide biosynthesis/export family protein [Ahrensia sp. R2A130]|uniref:polysaccharide biosynthesis/export family protein n=1 Tax=Ahrensia sp. R2A130 TaxID=744979 RepID=UPI0001E09483|nr:polysaccharide biosynthesis/export family protein [Ahrensia sp. R2A130]EFL89129.1 exopolysaccharide xanthan biosynthesis export protein GumB [Ahrensia sp. R2A130]
MTFKRPDAGLNNENRSFCGLRTMSCASVALVICLGLSGCNTGTTFGAAEPVKSPELIGKSADGLRVVSGLDLPPGERAGQPRRISTNDLLKIQFYEVTDLNRTVRVENDGAITMPLIGSVNAAKLSVPELESELERRYGRDLLQSPDISVFIRHSPGREITMDGSFRKPGAYRVEGEADLMKMVANAGGLRDIADDGTLYVYRKFEQETQVLPVSLKAIRNGQARNPKLYSGDVVVAFSSKRKIALQNLKEALGVATSAARIGAPL